MNAPIQARFFRIFSHILYFLGILAVLALGSLHTMANAQPEHITLASKTISLENRYGNKWVSDVFKDNILLTLAYTANKQDKNEAVDWNKVQKPFTFDLSLKPGETFAFHDSAYLPKYAQSVAKTTNAHFAGQEGFRSSGALMGDGVCHLASLFYWAAKDAGIEAVAPVNHDFATIPDIDRKYGVAIYTDPNSASVSMQQNLYIRNDKAEPITFRVIYDGKDLTVAILKHAS